MKCFWSFVQNRFLGGCGYARRLGCMDAWRYGWMYGCSNFKHTALTLISDAEAQFWNASGALFRIDFFGGRVALFKQVCMHACLEPYILTSQPSHWYTSTYAWHTVSKFPCVYVCLRHLSAHLNRVCSTHLCLSCFSSKKVQTYALQQRKSKTCWQAETGVEHLLLPGSGCCSSGSRTKISRKWKAFVFAL